MINQEWVLYAENMEALSLRRAPAGSILRVKSQDHKTLPEVPVTVAKLLCS